MPADVVANLLELDGALVEAQDAGGFLVLPTEAQRGAFDLPEESLLTESGHGGSIACGYGAERLRAVVERALSRGAVAAAEARVPPPHPGPPEVYEGLNVALRSSPGGTEATWTLVGVFGVDARADDRHELHVSSAVCLDSATPLPAPEWRALPLRPTDHRPSAAMLEAGLPGLVAGALREAIEALRSFRATVARRHGRDIRRVDRYVAEMDADLARRIRRSASGVRLAEKRALLPGERARRLATLRENYTIRATLSPIGLLLLRYPSMTTQIAVLRRKERRDVTVRYDGLLKRWHPLVCEGCGTPTLAFGACDDRVHLLCARCLAEGPKRCPRCRARTAREGPPGSLRVAPLTERVTLPGYAVGSPLAGEEPTPDRPAAPAKEENATPPAATPSVPLPPPRPPSPPPAAGRPDDDALTQVLRAQLPRFVLPVTSGLLQEAIGASAAALRRCLTRLIEAGEVEKSGERRGTRYLWVGDRPGAGQR